MSIEKARLLIRAANQMPEGPDQRALLVWAEQILAGRDSVIVPTQLTEDKFPIQIFRHHKGKLYEGQLLRGWKVQFDGTLFPTPSASAVHIVGYNVNGWRWWRYLDQSSGKEQPIDRLRGK